MVEGIHPESELERAKIERAERKREFITLSKELHERGEVFPFPGINPDAYARMKADDEEFPGFTTPIDVLIERCLKEGIKVSQGQYPESGNAVILPAQSDDLRSDSILPKHLQISDTMDEKLKRFILLNRD